MTIVIPTAIAELQRWPHWVLWRIVERDGKPTKVPFDPHTGRPASSTDEETWATYENAAKALERGKADGIGYVFSPSDEYAGVDLDHCVENDHVHAGAQTIVDRLDSYTELSPSGTGLHIIVRGAIVGDRKRTSKTPWGGDFESYDQGRFFTVTGRHLPGTPETIEPRQDELDAVRALIFPAVVASSQPGMSTFLSNGTPSMDDVDLLERIRSSKQGPKFAELYDRGAPEGQESEADLGLCNILAFWCGPDEARIDSLFRRSALMRDKWDSARGETTYGGYTIARALEGRTEFYGSRTSALRSRPAADGDDPELSYAEEISSIFGIIDNPIVHGWRSSRKATARVMFTTRDGTELDLDSWKVATGTPAVLAQEIGVQLGVEVTLRKEDIKRLNVLVGRYCELRAVWSLRDRAYELGLMFLQQAETVMVDLQDTADRWRAFKLLRERDPVAHAKIENTSVADAYIVLLDASGRRYVRIQWFVDYVKANAVAGTAATILDHIEEPGNWSRIQNKKSRMKATGPDGEIQQVLYEVPEGWGRDDE